MGIFLLDFPKSDRRNKFWQYNATLFLKFERNFFAVEKSLKRFSSIISFSRFFRINYDQYISSLAWKQKEVFSNYTVYLYFNVCLRNLLLQFTIYLFLRFKNLLISNFNSVKYDFAHSLNQLILRDGCQLDEAWEDWISESISLVQKSIGIRSKVDYRIMSQRNARRGINKVEFGFR